MGDLGRLWWTPGGRVEGEESWADCVRRETREETSLEIDIGPLAYVREFVSPHNDTHHFELLFAGLNPRGEIRFPVPGSPGYDERMDRAGFVGRKELAGITAWPGFVATDQFWSDRDAGFPEIRYLGFDRA